MSLASRRCGRHRGRLISSRRRGWPTCSASYGVATASAGLRIGRESTLCRSGLDVVRLGVAARDAELVATADPSSWNCRRSDARARLFSLLPPARLIRPNISTVSLRALARDLETGNRRAGGGPAYLAMYLDSRDRNRCGVVQDSRMTDPDPGDDSFLRLQGNPPVSWSGWIEKTKAWAAVDIRSCSAFIHAPRRPSRALAYNIGRQAAGEVAAAVGEECATLRRH